MVYRLFSAVIIAVMASACVPVIVGTAAGGAAAAGGGYYLTQRHGEDKVLIEKILAVFSHDPRLRHLKLDVDAEKGVVKLYGFVPAVQDEHYAIVVARKVVGVTEVISRITVLPPEL